MSWDSVERRGEESTEARRRARTQRQDMGGNTKNGGLAGSPDLKNRWRAPLEHCENRKRPCRRRAVTAQGAAQGIMGFDGGAILAGCAALDADDRLRPGRLCGVKRSAQGQKQALQDKCIGHHRRSGGAFPACGEAPESHARDTGPSGVFRQRRKNVS